MREPLRIEVWADWVGLAEPTPMGVLMAAPSRGKQIFSFEYRKEWLESKHGQDIDPGLGLYSGPQYGRPQSPNFGVFLDSSPDRWGRVLMKRREAQQARTEGREERKLLESDFLLGVHDGHRMGALRFRTGGPFLDDNDDMAAPPWTSLRELEHASQQLERTDAEADPDYSQWLRMLIAPGGSLGGARPKASVHDAKGHLWIAKFPSMGDDIDIGGWEGVVHQLAQSAAIEVPEAQVRKFGSKHHTFLSRRFDRDKEGRRIHFASAMTLLERQDGDDGSEGASYLELAELLMTKGASPRDDLSQLWRRIVFSICVSNTDDHLRNHGFLLGPRGWSLAPAYDLNPNPQGQGLCLNISETDNAQSLDLARQVAPNFRLNADEAERIISEVVAATADWRKVAGALGFSKAKQEQMKRAFRAGQA